ncbi:NapC/NirT family cytochrome c [Marichromatium gracile]|uniref:NapC/NirT family cytochrome c n=1 Tax=Marichromatium gracile TaxID=1048 RepID=UPI0022779EA1|nr:NapC/NirT family cytochrome c [Marichromatium gracile]
MPQRKTSRRRFSMAVLVVMFFAGIGFVAALDFGIRSTNTMEFCTSCHTMHTNFEEYKETLHYRNPSGVQATCADCHVPKALWPKLVTKVIAVKDVYHELVGTIDTPEKFEARRWEMASRVWAKMERSDSRECRTCHDFSSMDLSEQGRSARSRHAAAEDKGQTCIDCHKGIVHEEPYEPLPETAAAD